MMRSKVSRAKFQICAMPISWAQLSVNSVIVCINNVVESLSDPQIDFWEQTQDESRSSGNEEGDDQAGAVHVERGRVFHTRFNG